MADERKTQDRAERPERGAPSTSSVLWAAWRQGLKDLQNVVLNPFPSHVAQHEEPGNIAVPTQHDVYQDRNRDEVHGLPPEANTKRSLFEQKPDVSPPSRGRERGD